MSGPLHQLSLAYDAAEDRLLFRINTTSGDEYSVWLPRRIVKAAWSALGDVLASDPAIRARLEPEVRQALLALRHEAAVRAADFSRPYDDAAALSRPLGDGPGLIVDVRTGPSANGGACLIFQTRSGTNLNLDMDEQLLHGFCHMLIRSAGEADWDLALEIAPAAAREPSRATTVH